MNINNSSSRVTVTDKGDDFNPAKVYVTITELKNGKCSGYDHLYAEHFKYASANLSRVLSVFYNSCVTHG